jgi:hypothetical protein
MDGTSQFKTGELSGSTSAKQVLNAAGEGVSASMVLVQAVASNAGKVYVGHSNAVTKPDGTTDSTTGYELEAGEEQWFFVDNISRLWIICDNAGDDIIWTAFK